MTVLVRDGCIESDGDLPRDYTVFDVESNYLMPGTIVVPGNPLEELRALEDVLLVMSNGKLVLKRFPCAVMDQPFC